jgi:hypothetical protein
MGGCKHSRHINANHFYMVEVLVGEDMLVEEQAWASGKVHGSRVHTTCVPGCPTKSTGVPNKRRRPRGLVSRLKFPQIR